MEAAAAIALSGLFYCSAAAAMALATAMAVAAATVTTTAPAGLLSCYCSAAVMDAAAAATEFSNFLLHEKKDLIARSFFFEQNFSIFPDLVAFVLPAADIPRILPVSAVSSNIPHQFRRHCCHQ